MRTTFLQSKLHRATITAADSDYEGSISLGRELCRAAGLREYQQVDVYDIANGARFTTYVIYGEPGQVQVNGAAARLVRTGDRIIVAAYVELEPAEIGGHSPQVVLLADDNRIRAVERREVTVP